MGTILVFSTHEKRKRKVMDRLKMVKLFLALALAMSVESQPLDKNATSGTATLSTQLLNRAFEAFLVWAKQSFGEKNSTTVYNTDSTPSTPNLGCDWHWI